jgi:hypothetical protein
VHPAPDRFASRPDRPSKDLVGILQREIEALSVGAPGGDPGELVEDYTKDTDFISAYQVNGSDHILVTTLEPSNYQDETGAWRDIDTSLERDDLSGRYTNAAGPVQVSFPEVLSASSPATLSSANGTLGLTPIGMAEGTPGIRVEETVTYADESAGLQLVRYATAYGFEELVVLTGAPSDDRFVWDVSGPGLTMTKGRVGRSPLRTREGWPGPSPSPTCATPRRPTSRSHRPSRTSLKSWGQVTIGSRFSTT